MQVARLPMVVRSASSCACIELGLPPLGARRLFGRPMHELSNDFLGSAFGAERHAVYTADDGTDVRLFSRGFAVDAW